jgi:type VI protein secretion system component VasK
VKTLLKVLSSSILSVAALAVLLAIVWFGGEYFDYPAKKRILIMLAVLAAWIVLYAIQRIMAVRNALLIEKRLRAQAEEQIASVRPDKKPEVKALEKQLTEAIHSLRASRFGKGALYALPWYMIIGPPGVGKTTALLESGLNFPYLAKGKKGVRGVGGTRNCDWWFTDQGILLDTAGRYTTEMEDRDEWLSFLDLLKKCRRRKPINGAIVAMSIQDILEASEESLEAHAKNIRERVDELTRRLELVFPVYLVFTKCDLLNGFVEFFEDFSKSDRAQVWGTTLPYAQPGGESLENLFEEEVKKLYLRLASQRVGALASDRPAAKKRQIYSFPVQLALLQKKLAAFAGALFRPNPYQESSIFRGFYFTSGTQEGAPIDQVVAALGQAFGLEEAKSLPAPPAEKKSYFIYNLFTRVIFPDQGLARSSARAVRRARILRSTALAASLGAFLFVAVALFVSFFGNRGLIRSVGEAAVHVRDTEQGTHDLAARLRRLEGLRRELERMVRYHEESLPFRLRWGLYRGREIDGPARRIYFRHLKTLFLDPTEKKLVEELKARLAQPTKSKSDLQELTNVYEAYLRLSKLLPPADNLLTRTLSQKNLAGEYRWSLEGGDASILSGAEHRDFYISQLEHEDVPGFKPDDDLIESIKPVIQGTLMISQTFEDMIKQLENATVEVSADSVITGPARGLLMVGHKFPGLYTQEGWDKHVSRAIRERARTLSTRYAEAGLPWPADQIEADLQQNYLSDYIRHWRTFLASVKLDPERFQNLEGAAESLERLTGPESPYRELFEKSWRLQAITVAGGVTKNAVETNFDWLTEVLKSLYNLRENLSLFSKNTVAGKRVLQDYKVNPGLGGLQEMLHKAMEAVRKAVNSIPPDHREPARAILEQPIEESIDALRREAEDEANELWRREVWEVFKARVLGKFPLVEGAAEEVSRTDFSRIFNPKSGSLWLVNATLRELEALNIEGQPLLSPSIEFRHEIGNNAAALRDALYPKDEEKISVPFEITLEQRAEVEEIEFRLGDRTFLHSERPDHKGTLTWSEEQPGGARLSIDIRSVLPIKQWERIDHLKKEWGILHLFRAGEMTSVTERSFDCRWEFKDVPVAGGAKKSFFADSKVSLPGGRNPFVKGFFETLRFPEVVCP